MQKPFSNHKIYLFAFLSLAIEIAYIYHNPAPWKALSYNFYAFFLVVKPYTFYAHLPSYLSILFLWMIGHVLGTFVLRFFLHGVVFGMTTTIPLGWGILSFLIFALALMQCLNPIVISGCLIAVFLICIPWVWQPFSISSQFRSWKNWFCSLSWDSRFAFILIWIPIFFAFISSLMPPTQSDELRYHLSVPLLYLQHGGFYRIPDIAFSNFPFLIEYLYTIPLAFGLHSVPKMIHVTFFFLTVRLIYEMGKKMGNERVGIYGAMLFASVPFVAIFSSWSFMEMGLTLYTLLTLSLCIEIKDLDIAREGRGIVRSVALCGIMGGFLLSCKYTALFSIFLFILILICPTKIRSMNEVKKRLGYTLFFAVLVGIVASPWFIKNAILLGNPVYPFARNLFPTPDWSDFNDLFFRFHAGMKGHLNELMEAPWWEWILDAVTLPFRVTLFPGDKIWHQDDFGSWQLGPVWLTMIPFLFFYRNWSWRKSLHLIAGIFLYIFWAYTYRDSRFLLPAMAVSAPLFAVLIEELIQICSWSRWGFFMQIAYCLLFTSTVILLPTLNAPWWVVSGTISEEDYLEKVCDFTRNPNQAFRWLREHTQPDHKVLLHGIEHPFYCPNKYVGADWFNTDPLIAWSWEFPQPDSLLRKLQQERIRFIVYYYGKIKSPGYSLFYRFFRLPTSIGYPLFDEFRHKQYSRYHFPYAYEEWQNRFMLKLQGYEKQLPNIQSLEKLLDGGMLNEVFRYVYEKVDESGQKIPPSGVEDGIVILAVPDSI